MKQQHSPEPWKLNGTAIMCRRGGTSDQRDVCYLNDEVAGEDLFPCPDMCAANGRRIVACVNACEGIDIDALEHARGNIVQEYEMRLSNYETTRHIISKYIDEFRGEHFVDRNPAFVIGRWLVDEMTAMRKEIKKLRTEVRELEAKS